MVFLLTGASGVESVLKLIGLLILCAVVIAASYFTTRFVGRKQSGLTPDSNFKPLDVYRISQNKYLQIVQIGTRYFVLAVCKDTVTCIAELKEDEITLYKGRSGGMSFKEILSKISAGTGRTSQDDETPETESPEAESPDTEA